MNSRRLAVGLGALLLAGCAQHYSPEVGTIHPEDFGEANRQTYAAMVIDPDPRYEEPLATSAEHAADAVERYREGAVKQPETIRSTGGGASGSGGGSGGSGSGG
jgi:type IV pilus biogenesis protein CpaD/CtpE